jgi:phosphoribosylanthranilate isomerase
MTKVKICGVTRIDHAVAAAEAGADLLGLVFAPSKRLVSLETAKQIVAAIGQFNPRPLMVGVFVNTPAPQVNSIAACCGLDWVQLSGDEDWHYCQLIEKPLIKAIHVANDQSAEEIATKLEHGYRILGSEGFVCLLDALVKGAYGGTGQTFNWTLAELVSWMAPVLLAGGLTPDNVAQAISTVRPWGVDVSTGVETEGRKDLSKIRAFIQAVRDANEDGR